MSSRLSRPYSVLYGSEHDIADLNQAQEIPLDKLKKPRVALADFRGPVLPPQYEPVQGHGEEGAAEARLGTLHTGWQPVFMKPLVLLAFAALFLLFFVSLQVIWSWSQGHQGIATSDDSKHYLWTFGPTAVLVVVTVGWRQVDYAAKSLQPWAEMAKGPATADRSLLLDYVTPFQAVVLTRAIRNRHFVVASTITVFFLLKILTIVSTGLFSLDQVNRSSTGVKLQLSSSFTGENFKHAASVDSRSAYTIYGVQSLNLSYPPGTTAQYAVQMFTPQDQSSANAVSRTAIADVFTAELDCETGGHLTYKNASDFDEVTGGFEEITPISSYYNTTVTTSDCEIHNAHLDAPGWYGNATYFGYYGIMQNVTCSNLDENHPKKHRIMFAIAYSERTSQDVQALIKSSTAVCIPRYAIQPAAVTLVGSSVVQDVQLTGEIARQLMDVSGYDIAQGVMKASAQASILNSNVDSFNITFDEFFHLISAINPSNSAAHNLLDPVVLESASKTLYSKIAAQVASRYLTKNDANTSSAQANLLTGSVLRTEQRLLARQPPLRLMQAITIVMFCLVTLMLLIMQTGVIPRSPESLAAVAAVMARSPSITKQLKDTGHLDMQRIGKILSGQRFFTVIRESGGFTSFSVQSSNGHSSNNEISYERDLDTPPVKWIRPFSLGYLAKTLAVLGPIAVIITLEVTLRLSNAHSGLADVNGDSSERYAWLYVPTLVLVLLGTLFNVLDFDIEFSEPFHRLSRGYTDAKSSMFQDHLRRIPIATTWHALKNGRYALLAASISILLAPTLTIISSGLFTVQPVPLVSTLNDVHLTDWFNTTGSLGSDEDTTAGLVASMIVQGNMSYPKWTYDELVLPRLELSSDGSTAGLNNGTLVVKTPALRGQAGCTVVPEDQYFSAEVVSGPYISVNISAANGCGNSGTIANGGLYYSQNVGVPTTGYFGFMLDLPVNGLKCASFMLFYGQMVNNKTQHLTTLLCRPSIERLELNTTFNIPDFSISLPPEVLPDTVEHFSSWYPNFMTYDFQMVNVSGSSTLFDTFVSYSFMELFVSLSYLLLLGWFRSTLSRTSPGRKAVPFQSVAAETRDSLLCRLRSTPKCLLPL